MTDAKPHPAQPAPQGQTSPLESTTDQERRGGSMPTPDRGDDGLASGGNRGAEQRRTQTADGERDPAA